MIVIGTLAVLDIYTYTVKINIIITVICTKVLYCNHYFQVEYLKEELRQAKASLAESEFFKEKALLELRLVFIIASHCMDRSCEPGLVYYGVR